MNKLRKLWGWVKLIPERKKMAASLLLPVVLAVATYSYLHRGESLPSATVAAVETATPAPAVFLPSPATGGFVVSPVETEKVTGDVNGDGVVNLFDLTAVAGAYGSEAEDSPADLNDDGVVNIFDLVTVANNYSTE